MKASRIMLKAPRIMLEPLRIIAKPRTAYIKMVKAPRIYMVPWFQRFIFITYMVKTPGMLAKAPRIIGSNHRVYWRKHRIMPKPPPYNAKSTQQNAV